MTKTQINLSKICQISSDYYLLSIISNHLDNSDLAGIIGYGDIWYEVINGIDGHLHTRSSDIS